MLLRTFFQCWLWVAIAIALFLGAWEVVAWLVRGPREKAAERARSGEQARRAKRKSGRT
jgi:hypothetical protein